MSVPDGDPAFLPNPHLITTLPPGLTTQQVVDVCNYAAMKAAAFELTMVTSGVFDFAQIRHRAAHFSACADETAEQRWTAAVSSPARLPHSDGIAAAPTPDEHPGVDEKGGGRVARRNDDGAPRGPKHRAPEFPTIDPDSVPRMAPPVLAELAGILAHGAHQAPVGAFPRFPRRIDDTQLFPAVVDGSRGPDRKAG